MCFGNDFIFTNIHVIHSHHNLWILAPNWNCSWSSIYVFPFLQKCFLCWFVKYRSVCCFYSFFFLLLNSKASWKVYSKTFVRLIKFLKQGRISWGTIHFWSTLEFNAVTDALYHMIRKVFLKKSNNLIYWFNWFSFSLVLHKALFCKENQIVCT